jgi:hypothetical protein
MLPVKFVTLGVTKREQEQQHWNPLRGEERALQPRPKEQQSA